MGVSVSLDNFGIPSGLEFCLSVECVCVYHTSSRTCFRAQSLAPGWSPGSSCCIPPQLARITRYPSMGQCIGVQAECFLYLSLSYVAFQVFKKLK